MCMSGEWSELQSVTIEHSETSSRCDEEERDAHRQEGMREVTKVSARCWVLWRL